MTLIHHLPIRRKGDERKRGREWERVGECGELCAFSGCTNKQPRIQRYCSSDCKFAAMAASQRSPFSSSFSLL